ncbi:MAG: putative periplasmic serine endoprotease DegP-like precursor [Planctomycetota bacterium]
MVRASWLALCVAALSFPGRLMAQADVTELEEEAFRAAVRRIAPSVVRIETIGGLEKVGNLLVGEGPTTGLVVSDDGFIVSSAFNFAQQPTSILISLPSGERAAARIVARDNSRMLVLLKVNSTAKLPVPEMVPVAEMRPGQWSIAVGRTFEGQVPNASVGVLSAVNRIWGKAIQTDAKISPSNYGGPLIDIRGRVLGVLVPLSPQAKGDQPELAGAELYDSGIGFAVPMAELLPRLERWKKGENLESGLMGVVLKGQDNNSDPAEIGLVQVKSPAAAAGFKAGDKIVELGGSPITRLGELKHALGRYYAGESVAATVQRGTERVTATLTLVNKLEPYAHPFLGILPRRVPARGPNGDALPGVPVRWVYPESGAAKAGLKADDRIVACGGAPVATVRELQDRVSANEAGQKVSLSVIRGMETLSVEIAATALPEEIPADLPPAAAAASAPAKPNDGKPGEAKADEAKGNDAKANEGGKAGEPPALGVVPIRLVEDKNECMAYVPSNYDASTPSGLVVWLHAPGGYDEKDVVERWKGVCERYGLILLAPKAAKPERWTPDEVEFIRKTMDEVSKRYTIDASRVVVHGYQGGGSMAWLVATGRRETVRGVSLVDAGPPPRGNYPETDPFQRLAIHFAGTPKSPRAATLEESIKRLRDAKFPVTFGTLDQARDLNETELDELMRWVDTLDRI